MRIGLIAGNGQFPIIFSKAAKEKGFTVFAVAYIDETDPAIENHIERVEWLHIGQLRRVLKFFKQNRIDRAVMLGGVTKTRMFSNIRLDTKAIAMIAKMTHTHDDGILRAFARTLEDEGVKIEPSTFLLPELLAPEGCWTRRKPNRSEKADIELGWNLAKEIGRHDVGQCIVVGGGTVLAVEAIDGTDATISRGGRLGRGNAVVVKVCKPEQDFRFDVPTTGLSTIETMKKAGAKVLVVEAEKTIAFDREKMIAEAEKCGIAIVGIKD